MQGISMWQQHSSVEAMKGIAKHNNLPTGAETSHNGPVG
jgi:hypothetical protein